MTSCIKNCVQTGASHGAVATMFRRLAEQGIEATSRGGVVTLRQATVPKTGFPDPIVRALAAAEEA